MNKFKKPIQMPPQFPLVVGLLGVSASLMLVLAHSGYRTDTMAELLKPKILFAVSVLIFAAGVFVTALLAYYTHKLRQNQSVHAVLTQISDTHEDEKILSLIGPCCVGRHVSAANNGWNRLLACIDRLKQAKDLTFTQAELVQNHSRNDSLRTSHILDALPDGVLLIDSAGVVIYANHPAEGKFARQLETLMNHPLTNFIEDSAAQRQLNQFLASRAQTNEITFDIVVCRQSSEASVPVVCEAPNAGELDPQADQEQASAVIEKSISPSEESTVLRFICRRFTDAYESQDVVVIVRDVTQQMVSQLSRDDFIAHVSHEFRSPLTNIRAYAETLLSDMVLDADTQKDAFNVINEETNRLTRLVNEVLDLTRLESGSLTLEKGEVMLDRLIRQAVNDVSAMAGAKRITLQTNYHPKLPNLYADREKLNIVVTNLLNNAIKYTPEDGTVFVETNCDERCVYLKVSDTGIGIDKKDLTKIFEKFYRVDRQETAAITGTGLGLATTKEIVALHNGTISVESELNKGSSFVVKIPITQSGPVLGPAIGRQL